MSTNVPAAPDHAAFAEWDAAYVLGALTPEDRRAYESHVDECERCQAAVADLAPMPGLLSRARPLLEEEDAALPTPPDNLVSLVEARERSRARTMRRRVVAGVAAVAAVVAAAVIVPVALTPPAVETTTLVMSAAVETTLTASVSVAAEDWGTSLEIECAYPEVNDPTGPGYSGGDATFVLWVVDDSGEAVQASTWTAGPGDELTLSASTAVPLDEIASVEIRSLAGETLLSTSV